MVHHVKLGGEQLPISFGMLASLYLEDNNRGTLEGLALSFNQTHKIGDLLDLILAGLYAGAVLSENPFEMDRVKLAAMIDADEKALDNILKLFEESMPKMENEGNAQRATRTTGRPKK